MRRKNCQLPTNVKRRTHADGSVGRPGRRQASEAGQYIAGSIRRHVHCARSRIVIYAPSNPQPAETLRLVNKHQLTSHRHGKAELNETRLRQDIYRAPCHEYTHLQSAQTRTRQELRTVSYSSSVAAM